MNKGPRRNHSRSTPELLPREANEFIEILATTLKPGTCRHYKTSFRAFYTFLRTQRCSIRCVTRKHITIWLTQLKAKQLSAATRTTYITNLRSYLYWLFEQQLLDSDPCKLIRPTDIPRRPDYLPRPLPPDVDFELQKRFASSEDPLQKGLLLMRNTGIRIGELISLPYQCVRTDLQRNNFLKVPLGKLDNERLVPLDNPTFALIEEIQALKPSPRDFLFEIAHSKKVSYNHFRQSLQHATHDIVLPEPITSHRLRHSYATSLLSAGMSLQAIMRLLGHRDINMTLRYADVTLETVRKEFSEANTKTQAQYAQKHKLHPEIFDPIPAVIVLIAWLKKVRSTEGLNKKTHAQRLINRTQHLKNDLENFAMSLK